MGDRALIQVVNGTEISPVLYLHWSGSNVPELLKRTRAVMVGREGDVAYTFARMVAVACEMNPGNLSVGVFDAPRAESTTHRDRILGPIDSHGDAGCVVVNLSGGTFLPTCVGGYLKTATVRKALK